MAIMSWAVLAELPRRTQPHGKASQNGSVSIDGDGSDVAKEPKPPSATPETVPTMMPDGVSWLSELIARQHPQVDKQRF